MAKFAHADVLDGGLLAIKNGATKMLLIKDYTVGDSYATVQTNKLAEANMAPGDFVIAAGASSSRTLTTATKSAAASAADAPGNHHIAWTNGVDKVLVVTDETGELDVAINDTINFPAVVYTNPQPV